ncbi:hypothetical protein H4R35_003849 [Dimargaris xerosporica]|nr:hypothetical protein H4R35_003849 [Dimargaris xerosporica]
MDYDDDIDPFEARLSFVEMLSKVAATGQSIQKPSHFVIKHAGLHEDLYQCILEQLDSASITARMNILSLIDAICTLSVKASSSHYLMLVKRDLETIITKVVPLGKEGDVNVVATRQILESWRKRRVFGREPLLDDLDAQLAKRVTGLDRKTDMKDTDILKRIEEDRERHKRSKEEIWVRPPHETDADEFQLAWDTTPALDQTDVAAIQAENRHYLPDYPWQEDFTTFVPTT